ncbi:hypothetical protein [Mesorhizobium qingshengii]|uniref:Transcriptional regulator n=1 Tax=Mesorhizobium qingshengii TaxID=1165689 RepID=A0A1G5V0P3_9HYPH|nr:hypothetical protein [Mesorhizobium qingshengii]SDA39439.1 hypothetical protein SAMN02927914_00146 [Mesorhizobium qingshengii]
MNRGPVKHSRPDGKSFVEKAIDAHGSPLPDWLGELAQLADSNDLGVAGARIGYSRSAVSQIISGKYPGDLGRVEQMVRGALMALTVECPVLGEIGRDQCLTEQKEPFRATSRHRAQLFHACKTCPQRRK